MEPYDACLALKKLGFEEKRQLKRMDDRLQE
jgi:hypothetical protein